MSSKISNAVMNEMVKEIFEYWQKLMGKQKAKLTPGRRDKIKTRLKTYSVEDVKMAIYGCRSSSFHMGANDNRTQYNDLTLICRSDEKLEGFIDMADSINQVVEQKDDAEEYIERLTDRSWAD